VADNLTGTIATFGRDELRDRYLRDYKIRNPAAKTGPGTQPFIEASALADSLAPLYANAVTIGNNVASLTKTGTALQQEAQRLGTDRLPAVGASGFVEIDASTGGGTVFAGDELKVSGLRYKCTLTAVYTPSSHCPVQGIDTGPNTNQNAGVVLTWTAPRPGIGPTAKVVAQADGSGLSDGRNDETDGELNSRLTQLRANPPASGNDAAYQAAVLETPGLSIEQAFTYPAIKGPGTIGIVFTLRSAQPGGVRIPNASQIAQVLANLTGAFPADDGIFVGALVAQNVTVALLVTFAVGVPGFVDIQPWPAYASPMVVVAASPTPTATTFRLTNIPAATPQVGQTIGFYDAPNAKFRRKKILTATLAGSDYDIACDAANNASDTNFTPAAGQPCCPFSESLDSLAPAVIAFFDGLGPGEQKPDFFDPGLRERRSPRNPQFFPSAVTNRILTSLFALSTLQDVSLQEPTPPFSPTVGSPGISANLLTLGSLVAFPQ